MLEYYKCKNCDFIKNKIKANGKGTLFSFYRKNIYELIDRRNCRRNNIVVNLARGISKAYNVNGFDPKSFEINCFNDIDDLYMHTYVINGGYELAVVVLSDYLLSENLKKESELYEYEGTDELLFPFLFICTHAIELSMKTFIYAHGSNYDKDHNIKTLLARCIDVSFNSNVKNVLCSYDDFVERLDDIVNNGFAMRYPLNRNKENYLKFIYVVDIKMVRDIVLKFTKFLTQFAYGHCDCF